MLKRVGVIISEKIIRRIVKEGGLIIRRTSKKKRNSCKGEISPSVPNVIQRDFYAEKPNCKWCFLQVQIPEICRQKWRILHLRFGESCRLPGRIA